MVNVGNYNVYIAMAQDVAVGNGLLLPANGGFIVFNWRDDGLLPTKEWYGIADGGDSKLYVVELKFLR